MPDEEMPEEIEVDGNAFFARYDPRRPELVDKPLLVITHIKAGWTLYEGIDDPIMSLQLSGPAGELAVAVGFPLGMVSSVVELMLKELETLEELEQDNTETVVEAEILAEEDD